MNSKSDATQCPLCQSENITSFYEDKQRIYLCCLHCKLVFVPRQFWLSSEKEKARYDLHKNEAQDQDYRQFLSRLSAPLLEKLTPNQKGLDFGCGPGPTLSLLLEEQGQHVDLFDPYYYNDPTVFDKKYNFICATEVMEHLSNPNKEFTSLFTMLHQGGWLGIMTKLLVNDQTFGEWYYIRDMTHICFYSRSTFEYLALHFNAEPEFIGEDVILLNKK